MAAREAAYQDRPDVSELQQARAQRDRAITLLVEQKIQVQQELLVPAADVVARWATDVAAVRAILLSSPMTHADRVHRACTGDGAEGGRVRGAT
jgi:hypothetical protein